MLELFSTTLAAMSPALLLSFMGAGILLNLTPGVDVIFATACGISGGPRAGIAAAAGITCGSLFHLMLAILGLSAALVAVPFAYDVIRYAGAGYLAYLAYQSWTAKAQSGPSTLRSETSLSYAFRRGMITNILNPKVALFFLAFLPQFIDPALGPVWPQMAVLGVIFMFTGMLVTSAYGATAGLVSRRFGTSAARGKNALNKLTALVFGGLAVRLIFD